MKRWGGGIGRGRGEMRGADMRACLQYGITPLSVAAQTGQVDAFKVLLETEEGITTLEMRDEVSVSCVDELLHVFTPCLSIIGGSTLGEDGEGGR